MFDYESIHQKTIYLLKHSSFVQFCYRTIMSFVFKCLSYVSPLDENLVLFVSFMGKGFNDSPRMIFEYLQNNKEYQKYHCIWAFEHPEQYPELETIRIDTFKYFQTALKAKYWVTNTNIERGLSFKRKEQIYLNTWHGIALKKIGNDCPGRKDYNFDTINYLCVSGQHDEKVFSSAFNAKNNSFLRCGMPRNEVLWHSDEAQRKDLIKKLNLPSDKKIILYAPTWRESTDGGISYQIKPPIDFDLWQKVLGKEYIVLFRAHIQTTKILGIQFNAFVRDYSNYPSANDLMIVSDLLITDYSSIAFDYSILCRPILCYAYDYDTYIANRGTYFDIDDKYPHKSCRTEDELLKTIQNIDFEQEAKNTKRFRDTFIQYGSGATEACVRALFDVK